MAEDGNPPSPEQDALDHIAARRDKPFLKERFIDSCKGRGVFTKKTIQPAAFVVEYRGKISQIDARLKRRGGDALHGFLHKFSWGGLRWCVDAPKDDGSLGRLVNDDHKSPNCIMKTVVFEGEPHLCLFAAKEIPPGQEITYDYGSFDYSWRSDAKDSPSHTSDQYSSYDDDNDQNFTAESHDNDDSPVSESDSSQEESSKERPDKNSSRPEDRERSSDSDGERPDRGKAISFTRKNYCYVCGKGYLKLRRHLAKHADDEPDIAEALAPSRDSAEREKLMKVIRDRGNYKHNQEVMRNNSGLLKVSKQRKSGRSAEEYTSCLYCKCLFHCGTLKRHMMKCVTRTDYCNRDTSAIGGESPEPAGRRSERLSPEVRDILSPMEPDEVLFVIENDVFLVRLAQSLYEKYRDDPGKHGFVRQNLRDIGRLKLALHKKALVELTDALTANSFLKVVDSVKALAGFQREQQTFRKPNLAVNLGKMLKRIAILVISSRDADKNLVRHAKTFLKRYATDWFEVVSQPAIVSLTGRRLDSPSTVPFTRDVQAFFLHLEEEAASAIASLERSKCHRFYNSLCRVTLAQAAVLSRCAAEVSEMTVKAFQERDSTTKVLTKHFIRVNIQDKAGQPVAVLLTSDLVKALTLLVSRRHKCGVHVGNPFLFARPNCSRNNIYQAANCIKEFSTQCGAKNPEHLRSERLHKHMARVFQILNLENDELEHLGKLLGRHIPTQRDFYRSPEAAVELAKIARLIRAMEKGSLGEFQGNSLEEVQIEDDLEVDVEQKPGEDPRPQGDDLEQETDGEKPNPPQRDGSDAAASSGRKRAEDSDHENVLSDDEVDQSLSHLGVVSLSQRGAPHSSDDSDDGSKKTRGRPKSYCYVCGIPHKKISRHLYTHRKHEPDIAEAFAQRKNSKARKILLRRLRDRGNQRRKEEVSQLLNMQRSQGASQAACIYCKATFDQKKILKHVQKCHMNMLAAPAETTAEAAPAETAADLQSLPGDIKKVLRRMKEDEIGAAVRKDPYILQLAQSMYRGKKHADDPQSLNLKLRLMGRLLLALRKQSLHDFQEAFTPQNLPRIVEAVQEITMESKKRKADGRGLYSRLGLVINSIANIRFSSAVRAKAGAEAVEEAQTFVRLVKKQWATKTQFEWPGAPTLPFVRDAQTFYRRLVDTTASAIQTLALYGFPPVYNALLKVTLAHASLLNRNGAEIPKVTVASFQDRDQTPVQEEPSDSQLEHILSAHTVRLRVQTAGGDEVALTLTDQLLSAFSLLASKREACGVDPGNPYLFAKPKAGPAAVYQSQTCVRFQLKCCDRTCDDRLGCAEYRVHVARIFEILSLTSDGLGELAKLLGREIQTDSEHYLRPEAAADIAKLCELLWALRSGAPDGFEGKSFEEIEVPDELQPILETSASETETLHHKRKSAKRKSQSSSSGRKHGRAKRKDGKKEAPGTEDEEDEEDEERAGAETNNDEEDDERAGAGTNGDEDEERAGAETNDDDDDDGYAGAEMEDDEDEERAGKEAESEKVPNGPDVAAPALESDSRSKKTEMQVYFSDEDEDDGMNVDFDLNMEDDGGQDENEDVSDSPAKPEAAGGKDDSARLEEAKEEEEEEEDPHGDPEGITDPGNHPEEEEAVEEADDEDDHRDVGCGESSSAAAGKKNDLTELLNTMKEVRIRIPKLDAEKFQNQLRVSKSPHANGPPAAALEPKVKGHTEKNSMPNGEAEKSPAKAVHMSCSRCGRSMVTGQTAFQKKGFSDVFCSKHCLFETFPPGREASRTCSQCHRAIARLQDLIMAAVDAKGSMKDFCSPACLCAFKSKTVPATVSNCSLCSKTCTTVCAVTFQDAAHRFCGDACREKFCRQTFGECAQCRSACRGEPLLLRLEAERRAVCGDACLEALRRGVRGTQRCSLCGDPRPVNQMVAHRTGGQQVALFCNRSCVISYKVQPTVPSQPEGSAAQAPLRTTGKSNPAATQPVQMCYNCLQVIPRPHSAILAHVDDSGLKKELCSQTCLASIQARISTTSASCSVCFKSSSCKFHLKLKERLHRLCGNSCFVSFHKLHRLPGILCDVCADVCSEKTLSVRLEGGGKTICSDKCLFEFKEQSELVQLCRRCQTPHRMADMVEEESGGGELEFFCSSRCLMVFRSQGDTLTEDKIVSPEEEDINDTKPPLVRLESIKEEPVDDEYDRSSSSCVSDLEVKDELVKVEVKISSDSSSPARRPAPPPSDSCSTCQAALRDGETVYQTKGRPALFCSAVCLSNFQQGEQPRQTCHFCFQDLGASEGMCHLLVDDDGTEKEFCSETCLSSFSSGKTGAGEDALGEPLASQSQCSICCKYSASQYEMKLKEVVYKACSDSCFLRFCSINNMAVCLLCRRCCQTPLTLRLEDGGRTLCSTECVSEFKQKLQTEQPCGMCRTSAPISDMFESRTGDGVFELFCTKGCVTASKIQAVSASGAAFNCDKCGRSAVPACHLAMADATIRNFCSLTCAVAFKKTQKDLPAASNSAGASTQTQPGPQTGPQRPGGRLLCAQCQSVLKTKPRVIYAQRKLFFVCGLACSQDFQRLNAVRGTCENCKSERAIKDVKKMEGQRLAFCSDGCEALSRLQREKGGQRLASCSYCCSRFRTAPPPPGGGATETEFCSEDCRSKLKALLNHTAPCDSCGRRGKLKQSLTLLGEVKHFCVLKCLLQFCHKASQEDISDLFPPQPADARAAPVITSVVSLAEALVRRAKSSVASAQHGSTETAPVITNDVSHSAQQGPASLVSAPAKVVGHAGTQTVQREMRNKSLLCTPLVHNKAASCTPRSLLLTAESGAQTDKVDPDVVVLPVPVYVPVPMNMYTQYTPAPVALPVPLPVPVFLPMAVAGGAEPTAAGKSESSGPSQKLESGTGEEQRNKSDDEPPNRKRKKEREESLSETGAGGGPAPDPETPEDLQHPETAPAPQNQTPAHSDQTRSSLGSWKPTKLEARWGVDAWRSWIQWRESQTSPPHGSSADRLKEDLLRCSAEELSAGLCLFIDELKQPDGEPHPPDQLFYLCLCIQQHLFENDRTENIFSDLVYGRFSSEFTRIMRSRLAPSPPGSAPGPSCVEEDFLWDCKQLGAYSPAVLLNTLLFFCCKHLGLTSLQQHRRLAFARVQSGTRVKGGAKTCVLRFYTARTRGQAESAADGAPAKKHKKNDDSFLDMAENSENPLRCPVRLYKFYLSKCSQAARQRGDLFYLRPDHSCLPSSPLWFSSTPLDDATMEAMLVRTLAVRDLQRRD